MTLTLTLVYFCLFGVGICHQLFLGNLIKQIESNQINESSINNLLQSVHPETFIITCMMSYLFILFNDLLIFLLYNYFPSTSAAFTLAGCKKGGAEWKLIFALKKYMLLTKHEVKMAEYWPCKVFLYFQGPSQKERGQCPAMLTALLWSLKGLLYGQKIAQYEGTKQAITSRQDKAICFILSTFNVTIPYLL